MFPLPRTPSPSLTRKWVTEGFFCHYKCALFFLVIATAASAPPWQSSLFFRHSRKSGNPVNEGTFKGKRQLDPRLRGDDLFAAFAGMTCPVLGNNLLGTSGKMPCLQFLWSMTFSAFSAVPGGSVRMGEGRGCWGAWEGGLLCGTHKQTPSRPLTEKMFEW